MKKYNIRLFDPPKAFETAEALRLGGVMKAAPVAALFTAKGPLTEICRLYGYLMLLGQNLEFELRECLTSMQFSFMLRGIKRRFTGNPEKAKFDKLIDMFAAQLNTKHTETKEFIDELHRARKLRNRLAHGFLKPSEGTYFITPGGQQALLHRLRLAEKIFFPVIILIGQIGRGYASDYGVTAEFVERRRKELDAERRQIASDLREILGDKENGNENA